MRVYPLNLTKNNFVNNLNNTRKDVNNVASFQQNRQLGHKYTGVASADLAYASMFDSAIAKDLKLMGLI